jgi:hypothetical protein
MVPRDDGAARRIRSRSIPSSPTPLGIPVVRVVPEISELAAGSGFEPRDRPQIRQTICSRTVRGDRMALIAASIAARPKAAYLKLRPQRFGGSLTG